MGKMSAHFSTHQHQGCCPQFSPLGVLCLLLTQAVAAEGMQLQKSQLRTESKTMMFWRKSHFTAGWDLYKWRSVHSFSATGEGAAVAGFNSEALAQPKLSCSDQGWGLDLEQQLLGSFLLLEFHVQELRPPFQQHWLGWLSHIDHFSLFPFTWNSGAHQQVSGITTLHAARSMQVEYEVWHVAVWRRVTLVLVIYSWSMNMQGFCSFFSQQLKKWVLWSLSHRKLLLPQLQRDGENTNTYLCKLNCKIFLSSYFLCFWFGFTHALLWVGEHLQLLATFFNPPQLINPYIWVLMTRLLKPKPRSMKHAIH